MKRNYIIMGFVILIIAGGLTIWFVIKKDSNQNNNNNDNNNQNNNEVIDYNEGIFDPEAYEKYAEKIAVVEGDNAWYYQFLINSFDDGENTQNFFTGCNLKYAKFKDIEGYENIGNNNQYPSLAISSDIITTFIWPKYVFLGTICSMALEASAIVLPFPS